LELDTLAWRAFVKTFKRDYVERMDRADAISVMRQFGGASQSSMSSRISWNESRQERVERGFAGRG
jgi:hypothetical protein